MEKPILKISYEAFTSDSQIEDFTYIDEFKADLAKEYGYFIKPIPSERGGGAYELIVEFFLNTDLKTYISIVGTYLGGKVFDKIIEPQIEQYLFKPFWEIYKVFSNKHDVVEICEFKIELYDAKIVIYRAEDVSIANMIEKVLEVIYQNLEKITIGDIFPSEITIPVFADILDDNMVFRLPLGMFETKENITQEDYFKLWKLEYGFIHGQKIYDLVNETFIEDANYIAGIDHW